MIDRTHGAGTHRVSLSDMFNNSSSWLKICKETKSSMKAIDYVHVDVTGQTIIITKKFLELTILGCPGPFSDKI